MNKFTREETLQLLSEMGIELPPATKLTDEALRMRLQKSLNAAQYLSDTLTSLPIDPGSINVWPRTSSIEDERSVHKAVARNNMAEAKAIFGAQQSGRDIVAELHDIVMVDVRQTLMSIGKLWDEGFRWCIIQDPQRQLSAINMRLLSVHEVDTHTPLIAVLYRQFARDNNSELGARWVQAQMRSNGSTPSIKASLLEQKVLLKLLSMNAKHVSPGFVPHRQLLEQDYTISFFLPVGPLSNKDIAKLNEETGCVLCGKDHASRCKQCQSVFYCGPECQRADWPDHKHTCRSLKGGTWRTVPFTNVQPGREGMLGVRINRYTPLNSIRDLSNIKSSTDDEVNPDIHGKKLFLVKLQITPHGNESIMVYDRRDSFTVFLVRDKAPDVFDEIKSEIRGPRGGYFGVKTYRWAKRAGDWELSICVDRVPQTDIKW
ncbi:uncharacterized protein LAESUDRAFT_656844 [Laetiporus sulphureus 93-53]|uniref:MYND-type domain-containing protein n=1 Tax=Laetiporus sulphureus 93-53 TaxID=1314785 RepID=A0A165DHU4_9APHY|nr:uncharacterized protein LAESUDRAFT_656844 [Laetiporus sulphureus 93-53]KZT04913.1 hypothetical protein LAESUDRAFT_656844 [Laetiporus sulphureus 93-53]